jgi:hypothetical protein
MSIGLVRATGIWEIQKEQIREIRVVGFVKYAKYTP